MKKRVIEGSVADIKQFPYNLSMHVHSESGEHIGNCCGWLLSRDTVLRAAHCLRSDCGYDYDVSRLEVV
ncbi:hypothetical protein AYI70_g9382 [Smittium culicis]|uniref:Peptidase S1 domain-containing protein n=1 Tax=Smittium culicis TaxID=133412 RepID=A0A1R1XBH2_9FUNG|nr:hypothetical protein AYI70_g9382 [Smittium culicis]